jgi:hypothetical protein
MKLNFKKTPLVLLGLCTMLFITNCKKTTKKTEKCNNKTEIIATENDGYFISAENGNTLFMTNWLEFSSTFVPGDRYSIVYHFVPCKNMTCGGDAGIVAGGCVISPSCIHVCELKRIRKKCPDPDVCNGTAEDTMLLDYPNCGLSSAELKGDVLNVFCGYSGCDESQYGNLALVYNKDYYLLGMGPRDVIPVRVVNVSDLLTCEAYFQKNLCFNLNELKQFIVTNNQKAAPKTVYLNVTYNDNRSELIPWEIQY